jgi:tryptophan synthase alpha chain
VANQAALAAGVTVEDCFALATELIPQSPIPLQFIGYYNTVYCYGVAEFVQRCQAIGIAGLTFPDLSIAEASYEPMFTLAKAVDIPMIQLVSPASTPNRLQAIAQTAEALVYCVARFGVTGTTVVASAQLTRDRLTHYLQTVRQYVTLPLAVGFGLRQPGDLEQLRGLADMAVIGSALQSLKGQALSTYVKELCDSR